MMNNYRPVLDHGYVELVDSMPHDLSKAQEKIVKSARASTDKGLISPEKDERLLRYLIRHRHTTPLEHVTMTFEVYLPEVVLRHWVRHRTNSFNVKSGRMKEYTDFYVPKQWRGGEYFTGINELPPSLHSELTDDLREHLAVSMNKYERAIEKGVSKEMARYFLPGFLVYSKMFVTTNLWNMIHMLGLRMDTHAQYEIRQYAWAIYDILEPKMPIIFEEVRNNLWKNLEIF